MRTTLTGYGVEMGLWPVGCKAGFPIKSPEYLGSAREQKSEMCVVFNSDFDSSYHQHSIQCSTSPWQFVQISMRTFPVKDQISTLSQNDGELP